MVTTSARVPWRSLGAFVLVPNYFYGTGMGAVIPITPVFATRLGASAATAALVSAMLLIGQVVAVPAAGWLVGRLGERTAMLLAAALSAIGAAGCLAAPSPATLGAGVFLVGAAAAVFGLARHAFVTIIAPVGTRGRALSVVAGVNRLGVLSGPFLTAAAIGLTGTVRMAFAVVVASSVLLGLAVVVMRLPGRADPTGEVAGDQPPQPGILQTIRTRHHVLTRVGLAASLITMTRASRQIIVPLWAIQLGIRDVDIVLIVGLAATVDVALFYVGGQIMDHLGRVWSAVPAMLILGAGHLALVATGQLASPVGWFVATAILLAVGNGISSGIVATMGSDLADPVNPAAFLTSWRLVSEVGPAAAPLLISAVTAAASLAAAAATMGTLSLLGAGALLRYLPRHLPHTARRRPAAVSSRRGRRHTGRAPSP